MIWVLHQLERIHILCEKLNISRSQGGTVRNDERVEPMHGRRWVYDVCRIGSLTNLYNLARGIYATSVPWRLDLDLAGTTIAQFDCFENYNWPGNKTPHA